MTPNPLNQFVIIMPYGDWQDYVDVIRNGLFNRPGITLEQAEKEWTALQSIWNKAKYGKNESSLAT